MSEANNLSAPWILFEAGALSKTKGSYVCTFLLDVMPADVEPPLGQFQHTVFQKEEVFKLMQTINRVVKSNGERSLSADTLGKVFEKFWPDLERELQEISARHEPEGVSRSDRQLLEEVLEILRAQEQRAQKASPVFVELKGTSDDATGVTLPVTLPFTLSSQNTRPEIGLTRYITALGPEKEDTKKPKKPYRIQSEGKPKGT